MAADVSDHTGGGGGGEGGGHHNHHHHGSHHNNHGGGGGGGGGGDGGGHYHGGHHPAYPGVGGAAAATALDPKSIFSPHVAAWVEAARETLLRGCVSALSKHGVGGAAMEEAYREAHGALEGFERVVARWPDTAVALEEVLADADRLLLQRVGAAADDGGRSGGSGGLFRGYVGGAAAVARGAARSVGHARAAAEKARHKFNEQGGLGGLAGRAGVVSGLGDFGDSGGGGGGHHRLSPAGPDEGYVPVELASALTALKAGWASIHFLTPHFQKPSALFVSIFVYDCLLCLSFVVHQPVKNTCLPQLSVSYVERIHECDWTTVEIRECD